MIEENGVLFPLDIKILYVEDEKDLAEEFKRFLSRRIMYVETASSGIEGLEAYKTKKPDIIISDILMPGMTGIEMLKEIRKIDNEIPIILMTAHNETKYFLEAIENNVSSFLLKPVSTQDLLKSIIKHYKYIQLKRKFIENNILMEEYKSVIDQSSAVFKINSKGKISYVNENLVNLLGIPEEKILSSSWEEFSITRINKENFLKEIEAKGYWKGVVELKTSGKNRLFLDFFVKKIKFSEEEFDLICVGKDVTELFEKDWLIEQLYTDKITQLPNREKFLLDMEKDILLNGANALCIVVFNIDSFQSINDFYGIDTGDIILLELGKLLDKAAKEKNFKLYKMEADEFVGLYSDKRPIEEIEKDVSYIINLVNEHPFIIKDNEIFIRITAGISGGKDILEERYRDLYLQADIALKKAKKNQLNYLFYNESTEISKEYEKNILWAGKIKEALKNDGIVPFYQPILNNKTLKLEKCESLIRIIINNQIISPYEFLEVAKKTKYYYILSEKMLEKVFIDMTKLPEIEFSINLSVNDILRDKTREFIFKNLDSGNFNPSKLVFEITETEGIMNYADVKKFIEEIKKRGAQAAIDDFGTGYSNFSHILSLNVDYLKIDASLIKDIETNKNSEIIVKSIQYFANELGIKTIAEYVHNEGVFNKVRDFGIDYSQGYFIKPPCPINNLIEIITNSLK